MSKSYPSFIEDNIREEKQYYSLDSTFNLERCKVDMAYLGDVLLVNENLIWYSIHKYIGKPEAIVANNCIEKDDIIQLGRLGFIKAIKAFDVSRGVKFSSFAVIAIIREIRCYLRDSSHIIRPTRTAHALILKINRAEGSLGYMPSVEDLALLLDESEDKISKALQIGNGVGYLDETVETENSLPVSLMDLLGGNPSFEEDALENLYMDDVIDYLSEKLSAIELTILKLRLSGLSQSEAARHENVSLMRVSRTLKKIGTLMNDPIFKDKFEN